MQSFCRSSCTFLLRSPSGLSSKSSSSSSDPTEYSDWLSEISACHSEITDSRVSRLTQKNTHTFTHAHLTQSVFSRFIGGLATSPGDTAAWTQSYLIANHFSSELKTLFYRLHFISIFKELCIHVRECSLFFANCLCIKNIFLTDIN